MPNDKLRVDLLLVERGLAESRSLARRVIMAGQVRANGQMVHKPSEQVARSATLEIDPGPQYVSRGGEKLKAALEAFSIDPTGWICADAGASTGGFTDCLLQAGAAQVYAIDVGHGLLHWRLRNDPRVVIMEHTNARELNSLPEPVDLVTADLSFISLGLVFPRLSGWLESDGQAVALIKPQFEAGRAHVGKGGVVKDPVLHQQVIHNVIEEATEAGLAPQGLIRSPLTGPKGNVEFLLWMRKGIGPIGTESLIESLF